MLTIEQGQKEDWNSGFAPGGFASVSYTWGFFVPANFLIDVMSGMPSLSLSQKKHIIYSRLRSLVIAMVNNNNGTGGSV